MPVIPSIKKIKLHSNLSVGLHRIHKNNRFISSPFTEEKSTFFGCLTVATKQNVQSMILYYSGFGNVIDSTAIYIKKIVL